MAWHKKGKVLFGVMGETIKVHWHLFYLLTLKQTLFWNLSFERGSIEVVSFALILKKRLETLLFKPYQFILIDSERQLIFTIDNLQPVNI